MKWKKKKQEQEPSITLSQIKHNIEKTADSFQTKEAEYEDALEFIIADAAGIPFYDAHLLLRKWRGEAIAKKREQEREEEKYVYEPMPWVSREEYVTKKVVSSDL